MVTATFTDGHQKALELDLWILSSSLSHGRSSHKRAIHFQRLQMAKACFVRHRLDAAAADWQYFSAQLHDHCCKRLRSRPSSKRKLAKGKQAKIFENADAVADQKINKEMNDGEDVVVGAHEQGRGPRLCSQLKDLQTRLLSGSDEFYSRAFHASEAGMTEIAKGHFLPFLVVTFAALARLRALLLRLQAKVKLVDIPAMMQLIDDLGNSSYDAAMLQSLRADLVILRDSIVLVVDPRFDATASLSPSNNEAERHVQLLATLGFTPAKEKLKTGHAPKMHTTGRAEPNDRLGAGHDEDTGQRMTQTTAKGKEGASAVPPISATAVDALDVNAEFLAMVRAKEKSKKKRKEDKKRPQQLNGETTTTTPSAKKKKRATTKRGDFFDDLFG